MSGYWLKLRFSKGRWVTFGANFRRKEGRPRKIVGFRILESPGYHAVLFA